MGSRADSDYDSTIEEVASQVEAAEAATGNGELEGATARSTSKKSVYWIMAGLVVTGVAAGWSWLRGLPRDEH